MIINVGSRTDLVNYYSEWMFRCFREGEVLTRNPLFPNKVTHYELTPEKVDAVIFCSKNYAPALSRMHEITDVFHSYCYYTITAYGKDVEPNVPDLDESVRTLLELEKIVGRQKLGWRYDPVLLTSVYTVQRHIETFEYLAGKLAGHIDRCVFSFVEMYVKLQSNMPELIPLEKQQKHTIARELGRIAKKYGIHLQSCGEIEDYSAYGIANSGCVTLEILGKANGCRFRDRIHRGTRRGCRCIENRDIGWYDTCPNLCRYCYANKSTEAVLQNRKLHDPDSLLMIGSLKESDLLLQGSQTSFLRDDGRQISLFDF